MANLVAKISSDQWLAAARDLLIESGISGVKVDVMATRLGVSRGGFYHHFGNRAAMFDGLLEKWQQENQFFDAPVPGMSAQDAWNAFHTGFEVLIRQDRFDPEFELAVRDWAKISTQVRDAVYQVDDQRTQVFFDLFKALGRPDREARLRSQMLYLHQLGVYAAQVHQRRSFDERMQDFAPYMRFLIGDPPR
ncbi:TetR/AcrR family transcriptional regulator [Maricaulis sp.]|uniref:TetR/AcrR family transcriptional regulator n=1 Tax=Maricaulis sp. TaxID=1486257 RepID=UPI002613FE8F|nr:TetR/AcrR family transcriptional regulator [Maricaulis sp.]